MATAGSWKSTEFPNLVSSGQRKNYKITSRATSIYNCIAWAADDFEKWLWPGGDDWPEDLPEDDDSVDAFVRFYSRFAYSLCTDGSLEQGFEKIVIYGKPDNTATHAAKQLKSGKWTSKLGDFEDIQHDAYTDVNGPVYGSQKCFMRRVRQPMSVSRIISLGYRRTRYGWRWLQDYVRAAINRVKFRL